MYNWIFIKIFILFIYYNILLTLFTVFESQKDILVKNMKVSCETEMTFISTLFYYYDHLSV